MTTSIFDAGDLQRLDREAELTNQLPRQPIVEQEDQFNETDLMLDALLEALKRRL